jgi:ribose/xylose/arabinose/galactoside ABC-type transport system permease subunit
MGVITCPRCRHGNPVGARLCDECGQPLVPATIRKALGGNPILWLKATSVGQIVPFALLGLLLLAGLALQPGGLAWRQLVLTFGLVGLATLGVTFPLLKGQYDFSAGPAAALAACCAVMAAKVGPGWAVLAALTIGCVVGFVNGFVTGWTRLPSAMITIATGAVALQVSTHYTAHADLAVTDPLLSALGETDVLHVPVVLSLFVAALLLAKVLFNRPVFLAVGTAPNRAEAEGRAAASRILASFIASGFMAGGAGLLIACSGLGAIGLGRQFLWLLTPLAAALIGGGSVAAGIGNLRTVTIGAAVVAATDWLATQVNIGVAGPIAELPYLAVGILGDRWRSMTWHMLQQARMGNLLVLPGDLRLPIFVGTWRRAHWAMKALGVVGLLVVSSVVYVLICASVLRRVPDGCAVVARASGEVLVTHPGTLQPVPAPEGTLLRTSDLVTTGSTGEALLRFHDGAEVRLTGGSELAVVDLTKRLSGATTTRLAARAGALFARVRRLATRDSEFSVETPVLALGVRGTSFQVSVGDSEGEVAVREGTVDVSRELKFTDTETGDTEEVRDVRRVEAGQAAQARADETRATVVRQLTPAEVSVLAQTETGIVREERRTVAQAVRSRGMPYFWGFMGLVYVWFFFVVCRPMPQGYVADVIRRRAEEFDKIHRPHPTDSARLIAFAQMCLHAGDVKRADEQLAKVQEADPNSEYGKWASRVRIEIARQTKPKA